MASSATVDGDQPPGGKDNVKDAPRILKKGAWKISLDRPMENTDI
jgi:hypothetical protein